MRRFALPLVLILIAVLAAIVLWTTRSDAPDDGSAAIPRAEEQTVAQPVLVGTADELPSPASEPEAPAKPWETRSGFEVGAGEPARVAGRVVFAHGGPAPGAQVWKAYVFRPLFRGPAERGAHSFFLSSTKTDAQGHYRFSKRQMASKLRGSALLARHGELAALLLDPSEGETPESLPDLILEPAIRTVLEVVDAYDDPIQGARAQLRVHFGSRGIPDLLLGDVSDANGRLAFLPLPDHEDLLLDVEVAHASYPDLKSELDVDALRRGETPRLSLLSGRTVRGHLVDATGKPPPPSLLQVSGYDEEWERQQLLTGMRGQTDATGAFELGGMPTTESRILVLDLSQNKRRLPRSTPLCVIEIPQGADGEVLDLGRIDIPAPALIVGVVLDADDAPLEGARVTASLPVNGIRFVRDTKTDTRGRFELGPLPSARFTVSAEATIPGFGLRRTKCEPVLPGTPSLELRLSGGATLVVRFHPEGHPDRALEIHGFNWTKLDGEGGGFSGRGGGGGIGTSRSRGRALVRIRLDPGPARVRLSAKGYEPVTLGPVEITADRDTALDVELTPLAE